MADKIKSKMDEYRALLNQKTQYMVSLRNTIAQTQKEIDMLTGAVQALEQVMVETTEEKDESKAGRK
jgi:uncharacterized coiled-coil DUF342 family protein